MATLSLELPEDFQMWGVKEMCRFLQDVQDKCKEKHISGKRLKNLSDLEQGKLGMSVIEQIKPQGKVFNDPIHGHVELHPLLVKMINTPQFNRLRYIKQLGGAYFVFPGACHNRFEHSIGVAHLAGELTRTLKMKQPELGITEQDILCVQIAGLCHDLGHGPFSHLFDQMFIPQVLPDIEWTHEDNSVKMFVYMVKDNKLEPEMEKYGLRMPEDMDFIKELIEGRDPGEGGEWKNKGRGEEKSFLYEIVANTTNGIDVDKFDYFARDCHHLGIQNHFDHQRFFVMARVCKVDGLKHICSRDKEVHNLYDMFYARCSLHRKAYQHKTNKLIETMITDAFTEAYESSNGELSQINISEAIDDMELYTKLTDRVFEDILFSRDPNMEEAREILNRVITRDLYKCVGKIETETDIEQVKQRWIESLPQTEMTAGDFAYVVTKLDYGMEEEDPISRVHFYSKHNPTTAFNIPRDQVSKLLPQRFCERYIRIYCKKNDIVDAAKEHFRQWCGQNGFTILETQGGEIIARDV